MVGIRKEVKKVSRKSDYWVMEATVGMRFNVVFNEQLTLEQAKEKLLEEDYYDITDEEQLEILEVVSAEAPDMDVDV